MIAWGWLILAFFVGVYVGMSLVALLHMAEDGDHDKHD